MAEKMYTFATWPTMVKVSIHLFSATLYISLYSLSFIIRHFEYEIDGNDNVWIFWLKLIGKLPVWKISDRDTNVMIVSEEHRVRFIQSENRIDDSWPITGLENYPLAHLWWWELRTGWFWVNNWHLTGYHQVIFRRII